MQFHVSVGTHTKEEATAKVIYRNWLIKDKKIRNFLVEVPPLSCFEFSGVSFFFLVTVSENAILLLLFS